MTNAPIPLARKQQRRRRARAASVLAAQGLIFFERLWPALLPFFATLSLYILISLFDLWPLMPWLVHYGVLILLVGLAVFFLFRDVGQLEWPTRKQALARLEGDGAVPHAALRALEDRPFGDDPKNPLWLAHRARMARLAGKAQLGKPRSTIDERDPFALRYGLVFLMAFAVFVSWGSITPRLIDGLSPSPGGSQPATVDLWIDPPAYTGRAPVMLVQGAVLEAGPRQQITVPEGATLHARISDRGGLRPFGLGLPVVELHSPEERTQRVGLERRDGTLLAEQPLEQHATLVVRVDGTRVDWPVEVIPDEVPQIQFARLPEVTEEARVRLVVEIEDDYGITDVTAVLRLTADQERPLDSPEPDPVLRARTQEIEVTGITGALGTRSVDLDLMANEWAGLEVDLYLKAKDGAGQEAVTATISLTLPEREFFNPLAQAIIYERRNLAVAPSSWTRTSQALEALTFAPDRFFARPKDYLLLRTAYWDVITDKGEHTEETVASLWPLALQLEDEALELARRALEAAQNALREALERGASPAEIEQLVENLRLAMQNYIQALAESGMAEAEAGNNAEEIGNRDLDDILDSINDLSQSGANNAARQMLSELEQMLQNLQIMSGGAGSTGSGQSSGSSQNGQGDSQNGDGSPGSQAMGATGDIIGDQRELADETFEAQREQYGLQGGTGDARSPRDLQGDQQGLAERMDELLDDLEGGLGGEGTDEIRRAFENAQDSMEDAARALGAGNPAAASRLQEEALDQLRAGADGLAEQQREAREAAEAGENGEQAGEGALSGENANLDPLGRPYGAALGEAIGIPDLSDPERARELIQELRRRLSEPGRSREEIEYLERLLERF